MDAEVFTVCNMALAVVMELADIAAADPEHEPRVLANAELVRRRLMTIIQKYRAQVA